MKQTIVSDGRTVTVILGRNRDLSHASALTDADPHNVTWHRVEASRRWGFRFAGIDVRDLDAA